MLHLGHTWAWTSSASLSSSVSAGPACQNCQHTEALLSPVTVTAEACQDLPWAPHLPTKIKSESDSEIVARAGLPLTPAMHWGRRSAEWSYYSEQDQN